MSSYDVGDNARLEAEVRDTANALVNPTTAKVTITDPAGAATEYVYGTNAELVRPSTGLFRVDVSVTKAGRWTYRFAFTGPQTAEEGAFDAREALADGVRPTVQEVARLRMTRLKGGQLGGNDKTTFDTTTNPTAIAVEGFIDIAVRKVRGRVGKPSDAATRQFARDAVLLYVCMLIELSTLSEQTSADRTPYDRFKALYEETIKEAVEAAQEVAQGGAADDSDDIGLPTHTFGTGRLAAGELW